LEGADPLLTGMNSDLTLPGEESHLEVTVSRAEPDVRNFPAQLEKRMDDFLADFLTGLKTAPGDHSPLGRSSSGDGGRHVRGGGEERKVIYRPEQPVIAGSYYGRKEVFRIKVAVVISPGGQVKKAEPVNTTGDIDVDMTAAEFVQGWIFEPKNYGVSTDQEQEVEVLLTTGEM
jgi:hypothetical protein